MAEPPIWGYRRGARSALEHSDILLRGKGDLTLKEALRSVSKRGRLAREIWKGKKRKT